MNSRGTSIAEGWPAPLVPWNSVNNGQSYEAYSSPDSMDSQYELPNAQLSLLRQPGSLSGRLLPTALQAHVNIYLKYLYPIMPVLNAEQALADSQDPERLTPERYAFITALCAATHVQLQLDEVVDSTSSSSYSGIGLLTEATNARAKCNNICDHVTIESLLTSFFLFAAYGNLDRHDQAWFYLSQATSMSHTLGLHRESTYAEFAAAEAEERRRVFWLLFVTER
jgi:Fungal specific transcription factor domain